jgi:hypothetical protein
MRDGEDIAMYIKRAAKAIERMVATKVEKNRIPTDVQQAFGYIKGLNSKVAAYGEYKNYLSNAMETMKLDKYPTTMAKAIQGVARFHRGTKNDVTNAPTIHTTFVAKAEQRTNNRAPLRQSEGVPRRFAGNWNYCGRLGHKEHYCRSKAAREEHVAKMAQGSMAEAPYHTTFGSMYGDDEETRQGRHDHHGCIPATILSMAFAARLLYIAMSSPSLILKVYHSSSASDRSYSTCLSAFDVMSRLSMCVGHCVPDKQYRIRNTG